MAKNNNLRITLTAIGIIIVLVTSAITAVYGYGKLNQRQDGQVEKLDTTIKQGCLPARKNEQDIAVLDTRLNSIDVRQQEFTIEQRAMRKEGQEHFETLLKELKK